MGPHGPRSAGFPSPVIFKEGKQMDFVFGPIYPYTPGTWIGVAFWWANILGVVIAVVAAIRKDDDANEDGGGDGR
jgi:hypothetical protein